MKVFLPLNGKVDKDTHKASVRSDMGDVLERRNARVVSHGDEKANVSLKGMTEYHDTDDEGKTLGWVEDTKRNWFIYFMDDTALGGKIYAYRKDDDDIVKIAEGLTLGSDIEARVIGDMLIWTDSIGLRQLNIVRAYNYTNGVSVDWKETYQDLSEINLAIPTPQDPITTTLLHDESVEGNMLFNKTFQFAYQYKYKDDDVSVLSAYSDVVVHPSVYFEQSTLAANDTENYILMDIPFGSKEVVSTTLLARENGGLWFIVKEFKKTTATEVSYPNYRFYNNTTREYVSAELAARLNHGLPRAASRLEVAKNRLILGDITTNYNHPNISLTLTPTNTPVDVSGKVSFNGSVTALPVGAIESSIRIDIRNISIPVGGLVVVSFNGHTDIRINISGDDNDYDAKFYFGFTRTYTVQSGDTIADVVDYFYDELVKLDDDFVYDVDVYRKGENTPSDVDCLTTNVVKTSLGGGQVIDITFGARSGFSIHTNRGIVINDEVVYSRSIVDDVYEDFKTYVGGAAYTVGVEYYDDYGYTSGVEGETVVTVPFNAVQPTLTRFNVNKIDVAISGTAPDWATRFRLVTTKMNNFSSVRSFFSQESYPILYEDRVATAIAMPKYFAYEYNSGDYCNTSYIGVSGDMPNYTGLIVLGTTTTVSTNGETKSGYFLIVDGNIELTYRDRSSGKGWVYIFRPRAEQDERIYFHTNFGGTVSNGVHSQTTFTLDNGDGIYAYSNISYDKKTKVGWRITKELIRRVTIDFIAMTTEINGVVMANIGKPTVSLSDLKEERLQQLWYGGQYIENAGINDIRDFSNLGRLELSEADGYITGLRMAGDVLKVIQNHRETSVYIGKDVVTNADGAMQLVSTQGFLGNVNRYASRYGSKHPKSIVTNGRDVYYFDEDNGCFVRSSPNGQLAISSYGFVSFFKAKSDEIRAATLLGNTVKVYSFYDRQYNECGVLFNGECVVFSEDNNTWWEYDLNKSGVAPDVVGNIGTMVISVLDGTVYIHEHSDDNNVVYGENKTFIIRGVVNTSPAMQKCLKSLDVGSNMGMYATITTPITANNEIGQETVLYPASFDYRQGRYVSDVYQNIRTTVGNDMNQLYEGDDMQGEYIEVELKITTTDKVELKNVGVNILGER